MFCQSAQVFVNYSEYSSSDKAIYYLYFYFVEKRLKYFTKNECNQRFAFGVTGC